MAKRAVTVVVALLSAAAHGTVLTYCINNCTGISNRDYNSCDSCAEIVTCSEGRLSKSPCPEGTFFDSDKRYCDWTSSTCTETNSTSSPATQSDPTGLQTTTAQTTTAQTTTAQTTTAQTTTNERTSSTSSSTVQSNSPDAQTPLSQSTADKPSGSNNTPTIPSGFPDVQTTDTQTTDSQPSASTIQPPTTVHTTAGTADVKTFLYIRVHYQTVTCVADARPIRSIPARSKIECGSICRITTKCWYFQHTTLQCLMYEKASPPCNLDVYRYDG